MAHLDIAKVRYLLITDRTIAKHPLKEVARCALQAGFRAVQLREKDLAAAELFDLALELREITAEYEALLFINDRVDVALAVGADGVQIGWQSLRPAAVRLVAGDRLAIGVSAHNVVEMRQALRSHVDLVLFGPVFPTPSKAGLVESTGTNLLHSMSIPAPMPVLGLGGINSSNVGEVMQTRASGAAVIREVMGADDPFLAAKEFIESAENALPERKRQNLSIQEAPPTRPDQQTLDT